MSEKCPHCERGDLEARTVDETIRYNGSDLVVHGIEISACPVCSEELVLPEQARANELRFADAKRVHDGSMTSGEIVSWRKRHRLSQAQAAALLGGGVNAFSKYERGEVMQSKAMDLLMRAIDAVPSLLTFLSAKAEMNRDCEVSQSWETAGVVVHLSQVRTVRSRRHVASEETEWSEDLQLGLVVNG